MKTTQKGAIGEAAVTLEAAKRGYTVSQPTTPCRYDLVIDTGKKLLRTQVKYKSVKDGVARVTYGNGPKTPKNYSEKEVDLVLVYLPETDQIVDVTKHSSDGHVQVHIRVGYAKNNQAKGTFLAKDNLW